MKNLLPAMSAFRNAVHAEKTGKNSHFKSNYFTIEDVLSALKSSEKFGLSWFQNFDDEHIITTVIHLESGESLSSRIYVGNNFQTTQQWGGAVTYKRRVSLITLFGLTEPDEDGNAEIGATSPPLDAPGRGFSPSEPRPPIKDLKQELKAVNTMKDLNKLYKKYFSDTEMSQTEKVLFTKRKDEINAISAQG